MMQLITGANTIDISVTENSTIGNPQFVFVFINDNTGRKVACTSTYTELDNNKTNNEIIELYQFENKFTFSQFFIFSYCFNFL